MHKFKSFDIAEVPQNGPQAFFPCMIIVQARMGSTRLPGKVLKPVLGKPLLSYLVERLRRVQYIEGIVIATSTNPIDDEIASFCDAHSLHCFRGSEDDVLGRYYAAAEAFDLEVVVRITADCPLIDPKLIDRALFCMRTHYDELDYLSNALERTFPRGMDIEIIRFDALKEAFYHAKEKSEREHVTPFIIKQPGHFKLGNFFQKQDESRHRLTVDTVEDFTLIRYILEELYPKNSEFDLQDIMRLLDTHKEWEKINQHVMQKS